VTPVDYDYALVEEPLFPYAASSYFDPVVAPYFEGASIIRRARPGEWLPYGGSFILPFDWDPGYYSRRDGEWRELLTPISLVEDEAHYEGYDVPVFYALPGC
jgi:hypothetical protein